MATVTVTWTTADVSVPATTDLSQYAVGIGGPVQFVPFGTLSAVFADVVPGDYLATVQLANADGSHVEFAKSAAFTVPVPTVTLAAPDAVSVSLG